MPGFTTRPEIRGTFGVVATTHWLASAVGGVVPPLHGVSAWAQASCVKSAMPMAAASRRIRLRALAR